MNSEGHGPALYNRSQTRLKLERGITQLKLAHVYQRR